MSKMQEQEREMRAKIIERLHALTSQKSVEEFARTAELGKLDFKDAEPTIRNIFTLYDTLRNSNLDVLTFHHLGQIDGYLSEAFDALREVYSFDPADVEKPAEVRVALFENLYNTYRKHFDLLTPMIAYAATLKSETNPLVEQARAALSEIVQKKKDLDASVGQALATAEQIKATAGKVGTAEYAILFGEAAQEHSTNSKFWLRVTTALAILTLLMTAALLWYTYEHLGDWTPGQSIQIALAKVLFFSVLYGALIWASRNYRSEAHNYVVSKHRQNALSTFQLFSDSAADAQTKSAVLIQATQSIFSPQNTGFVGQEADAGNPTQLLEIIRSTAKP